MPSRCCSAKHCKLAEAPRYFNARRRRTCMYVQRNQVRGMQGHDGVKHCGVDPGARPKDHHAIVASSCLTMVKFNASSWLTHPLWPTPSSESKLLWNYTPADKLSAF